MSELLNSISSNNIVVVLCAVMSIIALFLAIAASIEVFGSYKKKKEEPDDEIEPNTEINIKEDANIKYEEEDEELEKTKAKIELAKLKERLAKEEEEKKKLLELNLALASKNVNVNVNPNESLNINAENKEHNINNEQVKASVIEEKVTPVVKREVNNLENTNKFNIQKESIKPLEKTNEKKELVNKTDTLKKDSIKDNEIKIDKYLNSNRYEVNKSNNKNTNTIKLDVKEEVKTVTPKINIEASKPEKNLSLYEKEEEENAIISYDELKKSTNFGYTDEEMDRYVDEEDAIISIQELEKLYNESKKLTEVKLETFDIKRVEDLPKISDDNKFQSSPFISPVYGIGLTEERLSLEQTANLEKLNEEIRKTNEFLKTLKELKKNLQ